MLVNPYIAGNPVGGSEAFVGRTDILRTVLRVLKNPGENAIVLYGQRRIGKTSVLLELMRRLPQEGPYQPIYFDLQDKAVLPLSTVLRELMQRIASAVGVGVPVPTITDDVLPEQFQETFLDAVLQQLPPASSLVLLFDEFDVLDNPGEGQAGTEFFPYLRNLLTLSPRLQFCFVIGRRPEDLSSFTLSVFKGIKAEPISLLTANDTAALVRLSEQKGSLRWTEDAIAQVYALTGGHPFLTQQLCQELWETAWQDDSPETPLITLATIDAAINPTLRSAMNALEWLWDGLRPAQRIVAAALAEAGPESIDQEELEGRLQQSGVRILIGELQDAPRTLQDWDLLEPGKAGYRFRVELLRRWIVQNKPLARVQQEIDFVQPAAENLFLAAYAFYQAGQLNEALPLLRQVVTLNPNHVRGALVLSEILLAQNEVDEAQQLLESLHQYHPAAAQARLVQVLLTQADTSQDEEQQRAFYERVLKLEPSQIENLVQKASAHFKTGQLAEAMLILRQIVASRPNHVQSVLLLSEVLVAKNLVDEAQKLLETLYQHKPDVARPRLVQVLLNQAKAAKDDKKRIALYEHILHLESNHEEARENRQQLLLRQLVDLEKAEEYEEALQLAQTIANEFPADHPDRPDLVLLKRKTELAGLYHRGLAAMETDDRTAAVQLFAQVVALEPAYRETTRYLHIAVTGVDSRELETDLAKVKQQSQQQAAMLAKFKEETERRIRSIETACQSAETALESERMLRHDRETELEKLKAERVGEIKAEEKGRQSAEAALYDQWLHVRQREQEAEQLRQQIKIEQQSLSEGFWRQPPARFTWSLAALSITLLLYVLNSNDWLFPTADGGSNNGLAAATATTQPVAIPTQIAQAQPLPTPDVTRWDSTPPINPMTGTKWVDIRLAITFVHVPAGPFLMGSSDDDSAADNDEKPQHLVNLDAFWIMQTEVTNAQYGKCVGADVCTEPNNIIWNQADFTQHPVTHVSWEQATEYAAWIGGRLPTEAEWEKAARGTDGRLFPWGNAEPDETLLNYNNQHRGGITPVGSYPTGASIYGALDMAGNVWEWVADWYNAGYYATSDGRNPLGPASGDYRVLRGGSWNFTRYFVRAAARNRPSPNSQNSYVGFRVVRVSSS